MFLESAKILVTGGTGFLGSKVVAKLINDYGVDSQNIYIARRSTHDLRNLANAISLSRGMDLVINLAANVGGIGYNQKFPGTLFYDNITIGTNVLEAARINDVKKVIQIGTVCSYPKNTTVPFSEVDLWNGYPEETNAPYGVAKKALMVMGKAYSMQYDMNIINLIPVNLYGPGDNFDPGRSHVIPALIKKFTDAKESNSDIVTLWGTGTASREFLYVDDAAEAIILGAEKYNKTDPVNIGSGSEISIRDLAGKISELVQFFGTIEWDNSKPDGQPRRQLDVMKAIIEFGFKARVGIEKGLRQTIDWYIRNIK